MPPTSCNLSQSAISRQVSALEQDLGVQLFHRHARGLVLTEQGETLYRTAHEVLLKLETVKAQLTETTERPDGKLRVTTTVGLGRAGSPTASRNSWNSIPRSSSN